jgi:hypothetical protein
MPLSCPSPQAKLWMNGACAIVTTMTRRSPRHDLLGGAPLSPDSAQVTRMILESSWRIIDRETMFGTLAWLRDIGHRVARNPVARDGAGPSGLFAYDYVRLIALAGWGYVAEFLSEEEAWSFIGAAAMKLQQQYRSWEELGEAYVLGARAWTRELGQGSKQAFEVLASEEDSPWLTIPWDLDLGVGYLPPPPPALASPRRSPRLYVFSSLLMLSLMVCLLLGCAHLLR